VARVAPVVVVDLPDARLSDDPAGVRPVPGSSATQEDQRPGPSFDTGPQDLDWLTPSGVIPGGLQDGHLPVTPSRGISQWAASIRTTVAGVDVRQTAVTRWLPQAGVVAVMAAATVGSALSGHVDPSSDSASQVTTAFAPREEVLIDVGAPDAPVQSDLEAASDVVAGEDGLLRVRGAEEASRSGPRDLLPDCHGVPPELPVRNGDVPEEYLCALPDGGTQLRADAAVAFTVLNQAFTAHFGHGICVGSGYRSYAEQAALRRMKPGLAARAGSSQHGYGLAVDLCGGIENADEQYWWLRDNAPAFGFDNPPWARRGGSKYEPWHWEYVAGQW
jgi:hypothetical protein